MASWAFVLIMFLTFEAIYCEEYLIALAKTDTQAFISAVTGQEDGVVRYKLANSEEPKTLQVLPFSRQLITIDQYSSAGLGVDNKSLVITASPEVSISGCYRYAAFAPLPVSALGTKYILPFCGLTSQERESVLVIASHKLETEVSITLRIGSNILVYDGKDYRNGGFISQHLNPHETFSFTFEPDVTGTVIETTSPVAVFLGSYYIGQVDTYDQLLPVSAYGDEYVVALEDDRERHELQITGDYNDTEIYFNDGSNLKGPLHTRSFRSNDTMYFNSTRPVMTTLCRRARSLYHSAFVVVPPLSSYTKKKVALYNPFSKVMTSVKIIAKINASVQIQRYTEQVSPCCWSEILGSLFKVGTCKIPNKYSTSFSSNDSFTLLAFSNYFVQNGGYKVESAVSDEVSSFHHLLLVSIICWLVILALLIVIAIISAHMRTRRPPRTERSTQGTAQPTVEDTPA